MTQKKILITGANGQLGSEIKYWEKNYPDFDFTFTDIKELDLTSNEAVDLFISKNSFDFVVNCAAYTAVDKAETDKENAFLLNAIVVDFLVDAVLKTNGVLIHVSTDYVFDGEKNVPYNEDDATFPGTAYGETKHEGEKLILYSEVNAMIIRTSWLYSTYGNNFVKTMLKLGNDKDELKVVFDQVGSPTYARDLAKAIIEIIAKTDAKPKQEIKEIYHYTNEGVTSWYDFAKEIFRVENINCKVNPVTTDEFPTPAKRPAFSVLNKAKIRNDFGIEVPHWQDSLHNMLNDLKK